VWATATTATTPPLAPPSPTPTFGSTSGYAPSQSRWPPNPTPSHHPNPSPNPSPNPNQVAAQGEPPLLLTRGVWAGGQRHGVVLWSSDIWSSFEELAAQVPQG